MQIRDRITRRLASNQRSLQNADVLRRGFLSVAFFHASFIANSMTFGVAAFSTTSVLPRFPHLPLTGANTSG